MTRREPDTLAGPTTRRSLSDTAGPLSSEVLATVPSTLAETLARTTRREPVTLAGSRWTLDPAARRATRW